MARPSKLNEERLARIVNAVRAGNYLDAAARYGGISPSTLYEWLRRGQAGEAGYVSLFEQLEDALGEAEVGALARLRSAARTRWQAEAWFLARRYPERWGNRRPTDDAAGSNVTIKMVWAEDANGPQEES